MIPTGIGPLRFSCGRHTYIVARAYEGEGYIGLRDGRIIARATCRAEVARTLVHTISGRSTLISSSEVAG